MALVKISSPAELQMYKAVSTAALADVGAAGSAPAGAADLCEYVGSLPARPLDPWVQIMRILRTYARYYATGASLAPIFERARWVHESLIPFVRDNFACYVLDRAELRAVMLAVDREEAKQTPTEKIARLNRLSDADMTRTPVVECKPGEAVVVGLRKTAGAAAGASAGKDFEVASVKRFDIRHEPETETALFAAFVDEEGLPLAHAPPMAQAAQSAQSAVEDALIRGANANHAASAAFERAAPLPPAVSSPLPPAASPAPAAAPDTAAPQTIRTT